MIRRLILLAAFGVSLGSAAAHADASFSEADRAAIRAIIEAQLAAFGRDDGTEAFSYASPNIQRKFGTAENFMAMVRTGYAPVYRPREVEFRNLRRVSGEPLQEILVVGPDGEPVLAEYVMQRQPDGSWRINGVILLAAAGETT